MTSPLRVTSRVLMLLIVAASPTIGSIPTLAAPPTTAPVAADVSDSQAAGYLLHLPGIAGWRTLDDRMLDGLREGGATAEIAVYDWTGDHRGLAALLGRDRNLSEAKVIADIIAYRYRERPDRPIYITAHSGGCGLAAWALEMLPPDVQVKSVVFLAPALSPLYDLTSALQHVRGQLYVLSSEYDVVLGPGTRLFGTIDGIKSEAAGRIGFTKPDRADERQYAKLVAMPYDSAWADLRNIGDHIGPMMRPFAREVLAPLVGGGGAPEEAVEGVSTRQPASTQQAVH